MSWRRYSDWLRRNHVDLKRWHAWRRSPAHRARLRLVRRLWTGAGVVVLAYPVPAFAIMVALFTTFVGFSILDESGGTD